MNASLFEPIIRVRDILFSSMAILVLLPVWILIAIVIVSEDGAPVFFTQERLGKGGKIFRIYKFRSMYKNNILPEKLGYIDHTHHLITKVGSWMRRLKIDETPQFLNVLKGEMSLVGPRPWLTCRIEAMSDQEKKRFDILPGLTGWAEVNGHARLSVLEQLSLDLWYVYHRSFWLDWKILLKTPFIILFGSRKNEEAIMMARTTHFKQKDLIDNLS